MKRPRIRTVVRALGLILGMLVVITLAAGLALRVYGQRRLAKARSALARQGVSLDLTSYESPRVPEEENAAVWFQAGASVVVLGKGDHTFILASARLPAQEWDDTRTRRVRALLEMNHAALEILHRGAALSTSSFDLHYPEVLRRGMPDEAKLRKAAGLLVAEGRLALRDGDERELVLAARSVSRLADAMAAESTDLFQIVGEYVERYALSLAAEVAVGRRDFPIALAALGDALPTGDRLPELRRSLGCDAALCSRLGFNDPLFTDENAAFGPLYHAALLEAQLDQLSLIDAPLEELLSQPHPPPKWRPDLRLGWMITPPTRRIILRARLTLAARQLVRAGIVIRTAGVRDGRYPPTAPDEPPFNSPNALNGLPLRYTLDGSGSARLEIPGLTTQDLWGPHGKPLVALDLPVSGSARAQMR
jgi:hypothetical protein